MPLSVVIPLFLFEKTARIERNRPVEKEIPFHMPVYERATRKTRSQSAATGKRSAEVRKRRPSDETEEEVESNVSSEHEEAAATESPRKGQKSRVAAPKAVKVEFSEPAQWVERMALTSTRSLPMDLSADDDPKREEAFIQQALLSVYRGISLLEDAGVSWKRPDDYYAEMYKSDVHMNQVRQAMEASKHRIEAQAHRRAMKDQKKYGKEVQAEVLRQRAKYKRDMQDRLSDWKKKRKGNDNLRDYLNDEEDAGGDRKRGRTERGARPRNVKPGGSKRPGKNARSRR